MPDCSDSFLKEIILYCLSVGNFFFAIKNKWPTCGLDAAKKIIDLSTEWSNLLEQAKESEDPKRKDFKKEREKIYNDGPQEQVRRLFIESKAACDEYDKALEEDKRVTAEIFAKLSKETSREERKALLKSFRARAKQSRQIIEEFSIKHDAIMAKIKAILNETDVRARSAIYGPTE